MQLTITNFENVLAHINPAQPLFGGLLVQLHFLQGPIAPVTVSARKNRKGECSFRIRSFMNAMIKKIEVPEFKKNFLALKKLFGKNDFCKLYQSEL